MKADVIVVCFYIHSNHLTILCGDKKQINHTINSFVIQVLLWYLLILIDIYFYCSRIYSPQSLQSTMPLKHLTAEETNSTSKSS